jgi:hypothetical protein
VRNGDASTLALLKHKVIDVSKQGLLTLQLLLTLVGLA